MTLFGFRAAVAVNECIYLERCRGNRIVQTWAFRVVEVKRCYVIARSLRNLMDQKMYRLSRRRNWQIMPPGWAWAYTYNSNGWDWGAVSAFFDLASHELAEAGGET